MSMDDNDGQMIFGDLGGLKLPDVFLTGEEKPRKNLTQETCPDRGSNPGPLRDKRACYHLLHSGGQKVCVSGPMCVFLVLFLFWKKNIKWAAGVCLCVCVCVKFWSPPNNFQTSYAIDTKFWPHIVSYRNSPMPLIPFLNFEKCVREKFLKFFFHLINMGKFSNSYYASEIRLRWLKFSI